MERTKQNMWLMASWLVQYLEWPGIILLGWGGFLAIWRKKLGLLLVLVMIGGIYAVTGYTLFPRYLLILVPFMAIMVGEVAKFGRGKIVIAGVLLLFLHKDWVILTAPERAKIAKEDHYQFFEDWSSGLGTKAAIVYLASQGDALQGETLFVPFDLMGLWAITQMTYAPGLRIKTSFYHLASEIGDRGLFINTNHHNFKQGELLFASNNEARNSVRIEKNF